MKVTNWHFTFDELVGIVDEWTNGKLISKKERDRGRVEGNQADCEPRWPAAHDCESDP